MSETVIRVEHVSKRFQIGLRAPHHRISEAITDLGKAILRRPAMVTGAGSQEHAGQHQDTAEFWALKDVCFDVQRGDVVGIIGRNGAGKSTLLKILARITEPTSGRFGLRGRVGSLLEIGTGFHPELTGRENIFLSGTILGMKRRDVARHFDEIAAFAEIDEFLDTPVKRYSSGMRVRLGFAVAAYLNPEILIVDEVLAVGDAAFQKKCLGKMGSFAQSGRTVLFVSHDLNAVNSLCSSALLLQHGRLTARGETSEIIARYRESIELFHQTPLKERQDRSGSGRVRFTSLNVCGPSDSDSTIRTGRPCTFELEFECTESEVPNDIHVAVTIADSLGNPLMTCASFHQGTEFPAFGKHNRVRCTIAQLPLAPGSYSVHIAATVRRERADLVENVLAFTVHEDDYFGTGRLPKPEKHGCFVVDHDWTVQLESGGQGQKPA